MGKAERQAKRQAKKEQRKIDKYMKKNKGTKQSDGLAVNEEGDVTYNPLLDERHQKTEH